MTHEELSELYELYALGVLDAEEQAEVDRHLAHECPQCKAGVRQALGMNAFLAALPEPVEPPKRLRKRVMASIGVEPRTRWLWTGALAFVSACFAIALGVLSMESARRGDELAQAREQLRRNSNELAQSTAALQLLNQPETRQVVFGEGPQPPRGRIFVNPQRGVLLMASNLPAPPSGKIYEMWLVPKAGAPIPAGLFRSDTQGQVMYVRNAPFSVADTKAIAVTLEPEAGSSSPTMPLVLAAPLGD